MQLNLSNPVNKAAVDEAGVYDTAVVEANEQEDDERKEFIQEKAIMDALPPRMTQLPSEDCCIGCACTCLCIFISLCVVSWVIGSIHATSSETVPPFARSRIWLSLAYHSAEYDAWKQQRTPPPSPPFF